MEKSKYLALGLSALLVLSLASCGGQQAQEPQEPKQEIQQAEPISTEPLAEPVEVKQEVPEGNKDIEDSGVSGEDVSTDGKMIDTETPEEETLEEEAPVEVQLFTDVEETVYATGTVNIRASYTADSEKLGSLSRGQSVTRTGTSIQGTEAEGWSRVQLSDGSTAYISNKYLSTTKPEASKPQQSKPSTSTGTSTSTSETSKPSSSTDNKQTETPSVEQQKPSSDKTAEEKIAEALAKAQAACDARGDGSYAVYKGGGIQIITPGGHMGSVKLN